MLTDARVRTLPFSDHQTDYPDRDGLFLRVGKTRKSWMVATYGAKRKRVLLGHYPDLGIARARELGRQKQQEAKAAPPVLLTFEAALETFYRMHDARPISRAECQRVLNRFFRPTLGPKPLVEITARDVVPLLDAITTTTRSNAHIYLRAFFNWAYRRSYIDASPIARLDPPKASVPRERVLDGAELIRVWNAAPETDYGQIIRLCILSGQRIGQWSRWKPEYLKGDVITWPAEAMKGDRTHTLPATPKILDLIERRTSLVPWKQPDSKAMDRLRRASGVSDFTHHDLRRTWATIAGDQLGVEPHIIEMVLAHAVGNQIARTYNRSKYLQPMLHVVAPE